MRPRISARIIGRISWFAADFDKAGSKIVYPEGGSGRYPLTVIATPRTNWTVTVAAAGASSLADDSNALNGVARFEAQRLRPVR